MKNTNKLLGIAFLFIAVLSLSFSIVCFSMHAKNTDKTVSYWGFKDTYSYYGGDAYTGIQHAIVDSGENTYYLGLTVADVGENIFKLGKEIINCVTIIGGFAFIVTGLTFGVLGANKLIIVKQDKKKKVTPNEPQAEFIPEMIVE